MSFAWIDHFFDKRDEISPIIIAGPCLLEDEVKALKYGLELKNLTADYGFPFIFKSSYEKANRTQYRSQNGPGLRDGLEALIRIREKLHVPVITDVHTLEDLDILMDSPIDVIQIPAFLSQSSALLKKAATSSKPILIKKLQTLTNREALKWAYSLSSLFGQHPFLICERGSLLREGNLVLDFRLLDELIRRRFFTICDVTHAAQMPSSGQGVTLGLRSKVLFYAQAATLLGVQGLFMETHWDPPSALSDAAVQLNLQQFEFILKRLQYIKNLVHELKKSSDWSLAFSLFPSEVEDETSVF